MNNKIMLSIIIFALCIIKIIAIFIESPALNGNIDGILVGMMLIIAAKFLSEGTEEKQNEKT